MGWLLLTLIGLVIAFIVIGGIVSLIVYLTKWKLSQPDDAQNLNERVRSLEIEVHELKSKLDTISND